MEFNGFATGSFENILVTADRLLAASVGAFIPLDVVVAFRVVLTMSGDDDVIAHDPAALSNTGTNFQFPFTRTFLSTLTRSA